MDHFTSREGHLIIWLQHGVNGTKCDCHIRSGFSDSSTHFPPNSHLTILTNEEGKGDVRTQEICMILIINSLCELFIQKASHNIYCLEFAKVNIKQLYLGILTQITMFNIDCNIGAWKHCSWIVCLFFRLQKLFAQALPVFHNLTIVFFQQVKGKIMKPFFNKEQAASAHHHH